MARIVLTTYTKTLAESLLTTLLELDPEVPIADKLGEPGVFVAGIDAISRQVIASAEYRHGGSKAWAEVVTGTLGPRNTVVLGNTTNYSFEAAISNTAKHAGAEDKVDEIIAAL